jgi:hypothetical protein
LPKWLHFRFLTEHFNNAKKSKRYADATTVSAAMKAERNTDGSRRFDFDSQLSSRQIKMYFSRLKSKNSQTGDLGNVEDEHEVCNCISSVVKTLEISAI